MNRFVPKINSICDVTKRGGMLVKGHLLRRSVHESNVEVFCFVAEPTTRILSESQKKPTQSKAELEATAPVTAFKPNTECHRCLSGEAPDTYFFDTPRFVRLLRRLKSDALA